MVDLTVCNTFFGNGPFLEALRSAGHSVFALPASNAVAAGLMILRLARHLRRERYDIVHMHLVHSSLAGLAASRLARSPVTVVTRHYAEEGYAGKGKLLRTMDALAARASTQVVAVSEAVRDHLLSTGVPAQRITVIYNGIDLRGIDASASVEERSTPDEIHFGAVGSLTVRKGHRSLLRAFAMVPRSLRARLTIIGEGPQREPLRSLIEELGIDDRVKLAGYREDVWALLRKLDVYVQPSLHESFGIAILEALASRLPVIATRTGGIPEIIADGSSGILVPPDDAQALAAAMVRIAEDPALRKKLAAGGRARVESEFNIDQTAREYEALYRNIITAGV